MKYFKINGWIEKWRGPLEGLQNYFLGPLMGAPIFFTNIMFLWYMLFIFGHSIYQLIRVLWLK